MSNWQKVRLGDILNFKRGHDLPKYNMEEGDIPVAGSNGIIGCHNVATNISPCITIGRSGNVGTPYMYERCWAHNTVLYIDDYKGNNPKYLYYLLETLNLGNYGGGSAVPTLNRNHIHPIDIFYTSDLAEQERIAGILGALDDKIECNNRINRNLEEQAAALFRRWFVDFEFPNSDGTPYRSSGGTMQDSPLGPIPQGWQIGTFRDIISSTIGGDWGKENAEANYSQKVYCIRGADITDVSKGEKGKMPFRYILPKNHTAKKLEVNDLVIEISGGSPTQSTGRIALISDSLLQRYDEDMICTNFCRAIKPKIEYAHFIYSLWRYMYDQNIMFSYENGTTGIKNLNINGLIDNEQIVIPPIEVLNDYNNLQKQFFNIIFTNALESEVLATLRDTLLPKLMNNEI